MSRRPLVFPRVGVVVNPTAGSGRGAREGAVAIDVLRGLGHTVVDLSGTQDQAQGYAATAVAEGAIDVVVVVGGDGTLQAGAQAVAGTDIPLAVVPAGSGNDLARTLGVPAHRPAEAARLVAAGRTRRIDLGRSDRGRWFLGVLAAGFDARVNARANDWARTPLLRRTGALRYGLAALREAVSLRPTPFRLTIDGVERSDQALVVAVGNSSTYGGGLRMCPGADLSDGMFDITIASGISHRSLVRLVPALVAGRHVEHPEVEVLRGREVTLAAQTREPVECHADGDSFAALPVTVRVVPGALTMVVP